MVLDSRITFFCLACNILGTVKHNFFFLIIDLCLKLYALQSIPGSCSVHYLQCEFNHRDFNYVQDGVNKNSNENINV